VRGDLLCVERRHIAPDTNGEIGPCPSNQRLDGGKSVGAMIEKLSWLHIVTRGSRRGATPLLAMTYVLAGRKKSA
jgi:hypothetical protein